jgi:hypothetical protein
MDKVSEKKIFNPLPEETLRCHYVVGVSENKYILNIDTFNSYQMQICANENSTNSLDICSFKMSTCEKGLCCKCVNNKSVSPVTVSAVDDLNVEILEDSSECKHNIVDDYIDITPDRSMKIKYCDICLMTF